MSFCIAVLFPTDSVEEQELCVEEQHEDLTGSGFGAQHDVFLLEQQLDVITGDLIALTLMPSALADVNFTPLTFSLGSLSSLPTNNPATIALVTAAMGRMIAIKGPSNA
ncbi:hypothetical protein VIN01S_28760 [Vibrio inusitatus NBRC 102082]|uniref:Uncharacterized protein n=1 Tax=Vibrio inusitatus NBRC 102082 TaxID=1219070 RepID=A0A4Y3HZP1_9VIBR|nr:hypothetical protein VIN01S_28760 [Vibrio inusitatus NBRC 102082]